MKIAALVVTYNRKQLLECCIRALLSQTYNLSKIFIVDNNSSDGTDNWFYASAYNTQKIEYIRLNQNEGGSAGFAHGLKSAFDSDYDKVWIMDDDAAPSLNALEELLKIVKSNNCIYGSLATDGTRASWLTTVIRENSSNLITRNLDDIPSEAKVVFLPFLGLLISKEIFLRIGPPRKDFFLAADDVEYCMRAKKQGMDIMIGGKSKILHPSAHIYTLNFFGRIFYCISLPPWKRYYDTRNRLLIAKEHYKLKWLFQTIPGSFIRLLAALIYEKNRRQQTWAFFAGLIDGIAGKTGKRHTNWKIKQ